MESGGVGITVVIPRAAPFWEDHRGRYYVKVVADEEPLGETATYLPAYCRMPSLFLSARRRRRRPICDTDESTVPRHVARSIEIEIPRDLADPTDTDLGDGSLRFAKSNSACLGHRRASSRFRDIRRILERIKLEKSIKPVDRFRRCLYKQGDARLSY